MTAGPGATTDRPEARRGGASSPAPRLAAVSLGALLVTPVRAAAAGAILAGSVAEGLSGSAALIAVLLGAMLFVVAGASARRRVRFRDLPPPPVEARYSTWWQSGLRAALPSTVIVSLLGAAALGFSPETAAVCAGLLAGMAILGLGVAVPLVREERRTRRRLYVDWSILQPRRFAGRQP